MLKLKRRPPNFVPPPAERLEALRDLPLAGFGARFAAFAIDMGVVVVICGGIEVLLALDKIRNSSNAHPVHLEVNPFHGWSILVLLLYFGLLTFLGHGQTPGKRLLRIRVVSVVHGHLSFWHALDRALGYGVSVLEGASAFCSTSSIPTARRCTTASPRRSW